MRSPPVFLSPLLHSICLHICIYLYLQAEIISTVYNYKKNLDVGLLLLVPVVFTIELTCRKISGYRQLSQYDSY